MDASKLKNASCSTRDPDPTWNMLLEVWEKAATFPGSTTTSFGSPVEPDVQVIGQVIVGGGITRLIETVGHAESVSVAQPLY